jgi:hypothetical protein
VWAKTTATTRLARLDSRRRPESRTAVAAMVWLTALALGSQPLNIDRIDHIDDLA